MLLPPLLSCRRRRPLLPRAAWERRLCSAEAADCRQDAQLPPCDGSVPGAAAAGGDSGTEPDAAAAAGSGSSGSSVGAIVGGVVGGLAAAAAVLAGVLLLRRRRRRRRRERRELPFYAVEARPSKVGHKR